MFCASPVADDTGLKSYRIDYTVASQSAPDFRISGKSVPRQSIVFSCTAIGYTDGQTEKWFGHDGLIIECVGIPGFPGTRYPRVAGLIRFSATAAKDGPIKFVHGDVLDPRASGVRVVCQLVNDQARTWGGGVAKNTAKKYPDAQRDFSSWIVSVPRSERLGKVHFFNADKSTIIASLVSQQGYGASLFPRIRYSALDRCFEQVSEMARDRSATVHLPRIGTGQSGGSWATVEEILRDTLVAERVPITVYDLPPRRTPGAADLFD
jgi:O-acetyl-ADP-ribose deacetylase (regulator of RNase III)